MIELEIQRCARCGTSAFPDRLWCPACGAGEFRHAAAGPGRVEEETALRRSAEPVRIGTVRLEAGPLIIARLASDTGAGTHVWLERTTERTIWARATPD
jgi:uncharacterized OB-fold protein